MKSFKIILILLFFTIGFQLASSQTYKFRTSGYSILNKTEKGTWGNWSDLELINIPVELDTDRHRIVVYTQLVQWFEIDDYIAREENDTDIVYSFICRDQNGVSTKLSIITRKKQGNRKQLYINYDQQIIVYNLFSV